MTLIDAGPLVALIDVGDPHHASSVAAVDALPPAPFLVTWPCFTEAMYLPGSVGGHRFRAALWQWRALGRLTLHDLTAEEIGRMISLMDRYRDVPMDLADASIVAAAESVPGAQILTLDSDFFIYRAATGEGLNVVRCTA